MIAVCELQCKGLSHEKVNSGFLYALRITFPNEKILFFAEQSHISSIRSILINDKIEIQNLEFAEINFPDKTSYYSICSTYFLLKRILNKLKAQGVDKLFLLSFNPIILHYLKSFTKKDKFYNFKFTLVLHGGFENIASKSDFKLLDLYERYPMAVSELRKKDRYFVSPKRAIKYLFYKTRLIKSSFIEWIYQIQESKIDSLFNYKNVLLEAPTFNFKYLSLSPHIINNARKYIDIDLINIYSVVLPTVFSELSQKTPNKYVKFAVFGYGRPKVLREIMFELEKKEIKYDYEIKIIGMDNFGLSKFSNISCPNPGRRLSRKEMEYYALDVDMFLILYDKSQYRLSCSGSILEAISYRKPILNFENDCINYFNNLENPIGITSATIREYADNLEYIINNYKNFIPQLDLYKKNIDVLRSKYKIENFSEEIKKSFTW